MPRRHAPDSHLAPATVSVRTLRDHPALARIIPSLPARSLTRLYDAVGLNDAGSLMALTPVPLLTRALDEAVWTERDGTTRFDADTFVDWLEVWLDEGDAFAVERLLALDEDTLALCFGAVLRVADSHASAFSREPHDGGEPNPAAGGLLEPGAGTEVFGRFLVSAVLDDEWDVVHGALTALWTDAGERLLALLERLALDGGRPGRGTVHDRLHADAAGAREQRRERSGFVPAESARAFLAQAHTLSIRTLLAMTAYDLETDHHMRELAQGPEAEDETTAEPGPAAAAGADGRQFEDHGALADVWRLLVSAGVAEAATPAGLLTGPAASESTLRRHMDDLAASNPDALVHVGSELAYLANVLLAGVHLPESGRGRDTDARELAFATADLGIELLEGRGVGITLGHPPGLVQAFLIAWRALAELPPRLVQAFEHALAAPVTTRQLDAKAWLQPQMLESLDDLRHAVREGRMPDGREAIGLLSLALDSDACRAAAHLLADPPRFPGLLEGGDKDTARWFRSVRDLTRAGELLRGLTREAPPPRRS